MNLFTHVVAENLLLIRGLIVGTALFSIVVARRK